MDCLALLRVSARLLDLHDAERELGNASVFSTEDRRGRRDGFYLDIAGAVLEALRAYAHGTGNAFLGFDALLLEVRESLPALDAEDLRYVLNVLSRPTELWAIERQAEASKLISDKASALVERTFFADDYRLTPAGRAAIAVAANVQSFAYAEGDVLKLLRAIEAGDFTRVPVFCDAVLDTIRFESVDLRQLIEKGFVDRQSTIYTDHLPRYMQVIKESSSLLRQADARLKAWRTSGDDSLDDSIEVDLYDLEQQVLRVYQALESFGRDLSELTAMAAKRRESVVAPPDFLDAALCLVMRPATARQTAYLFRQFGPISFDGVFPSPLDVAGKVRIPLTREIPPGSFNTDGAITVTRNLQLIFLDEHGAAMRERLHQGPLPLSDALARGWCRVEGQPALGELLGIYAAPWLLGPELPVEIRVPDELSGQTHALLGDLILSDLELALVQEGGPDDTV
jgi:hypothetical protein